MLHELMSQWKKSWSVAVAQDRIREKTALVQRGFPTAPFHPVKDPEELAAALDVVGLQDQLADSAEDHDSRFPGLNGVHAAVRRSERKPARHYLRKFRVVSAEKLAIWCTAYVGSLNQHSDRASSRERRWLGVE